MSSAISEMFEEASASLIDQFVVPNSVPEDWNLDGLQEAFRRDLNLEVEPKAWLAEQPTLEEAALRARIHDTVRQAYQGKVQRYGAEIMRHIERDVVLRTLDQHWREHLAAMEYLKQGIHLRGYAQKDYRFEFKREAFELFSAMLDRVKFDTVSTLTKIEIRTQEQIDREEAERRERLMKALRAQHEEVQPLLGGGGEPELAIGGLGAAAAAAGRMPDAVAAAPEAAVAPFVRSDRKVGRNEPCPCGSGRKFKHCHGTLAGNQ
jgi:preprotein translocase subunit SecA